MPRTGARRASRRSASRGFRVDAVDATGRLVEVQSGPLGPLRGKLARLLPEHRVRVVKPVVLERRVVRSRGATGPTSRRGAARSGALVDVFDDLIGWPRLPAPQPARSRCWRSRSTRSACPRRRWPGYAVADRRLRDSLGGTTLAAAGRPLDALPRAGIGGPVHDPRAGRAARTAARRSPSGSRTACGCRGRSRPSASRGTAGSTSGRRGRRSVDPRVGGADGSPRPVPARRQAGLRDGGEPRARLRDGPGAGRGRGRPRPDRPRRRPRSSRPATALADTGRQVEVLAADVGEPDAERGRRPRGGRRLRPDRHPGQQRRRPADRRADRGASPPTTGSGSST